MILAAVGAALVCNYSIVVVIGVYNITSGATMIAFAHRIVRCGVAVGLQAVFLANTALAQDVLPPVVVTTPSPVAKTPVAAKPA